MNTNVESFETVPWSIDRIIDEITSENVTSALAEYNVPNVTKNQDSNENSLVQREITPVFDHEVDLSFLETAFGVTPEDAMAAEKLVNLSAGTSKPVPAVKAMVCVSKLDVNVDVVAVVNEAAAAVIESGQTDFDPDEEQRKLLNLLQTPTPAIPTSTSALEPVVPKLDFRVVRCQNCLKNFEFEEFRFHVCKYDENHQLITLPATIENTPGVTYISKIEQVLPDEPPAIRLLRENQIRIRRFLKEELKYELPAIAIQQINNNTDSNSLWNSNSGRGGSNYSDLSFQASTSKQAAAAAAAKLNNNNSNGGKKQEVSHECTICDRRFVHASGLLRHIEKHALDLIPTSNSRQITMPPNSQCLRIVLKCQLCGRVFFEQKFAFKHLFTHFPNSSNDGIEMDNYMDVPYEAFVDDAVAYIQEEQISSSLNAFNRQHDTKASNYLKIIVLGNVLQCEFCDYIFTDVSYLFLHSSVHSPERRFECLSCEISVGTSKEVFSHFQAECVFLRESLKIAQANIQRYFVCNVCEKKFQNLEHLHEHRYTTFHFFPRLNSILQKLQTPCEYCELIFDNVKDLVVHFEEQHFKKCKRDKDLGPINNNNNNITSHKLRQYLCDVCGKSYTQSSHLWQHLRFHQGVKPFACQEPGCSRKFTIRPDLHDHIRKCHTGERPFHCYICGKRFLTGSVFYQHRLIHRGERRYECSQCGKRFYRADALKNHTRIHTGEKPYDCEYCTKSFRQRGDCEKHIRARHAHLDENTRNMLKIQKMNLKSAAANKLNEQKQSLQNVHLNNQS